MKALVDTTPEAERIQFDLWARMSPNERLARATDMSRMLMEASRAVIDRLHPHATNSERIALYVRAQYGNELARAVQARLEFKA